MRHPGAGPFALSSTVDIDVLSLRQQLDFLVQIIWFDANRSPDPRGAGIVVAMASHVHQEKLVAILRLELARKFLDLNARNYAVNTILPVKPEAIADIAGQCKREHDLQHVTSRVKSTGDGQDKVAENVTFSTNSNRGLSSSGIMIHGDFISNSAMNLSVLDPGQYSL